MQFPIDIALRRSRLLLVLTGLLHALAATSLWLLSWPLSARSALLALVAFSLWQQLRRPSRVVGLRLAEDGELACQCANGEQISAAVQPDTVVFSQLVVLRVRDRDTARLDTLVLLPDSMPAARFRLLRLWLRWRAEASGRRLEGGA